MTREEELYWRNQPEWVVNAEMERRLKEYFESDVFLKKEHKKELRDRKNEKHRLMNLDNSIEKLKEAM